MKIGYFSTDWTSEPVPDPEKSKPGKPVFIPDQKRLTFGGTFLTRGAMPAMELKKHGYDVFLSWRLGDDPSGAFTAMDTEGNWHTPDILWLQRHMGEGFDILTKRARAAGQVVIHDLDDSFGNGILPKTNLAHQSTDPKNNPTFNRVHYYRNLAASSAVIVSTQALYREIATLGVPVYLCRNMINLEQWPQLNPESHECVVGWTGGIQWRARDMEVLKQFLPSFLEDFGLTFYHGGDSQVPNVPHAWDLIGIDPQVIKVAAAPLCHIAEYPKLWQPISISLIPLEDCKFNHAKSALKALEASACGLPFIASDLPEQRWFVEHGGAGRLAKNWKPKTWENHLLELMDPDVRREEGKLNRAHAELFDIKDTWRQWADVYAEVVA